MTDQDLTLRTTGSVLHRPRSYDLLVWVLTLGRERAFREKVVGLARLEGGESVLDVGCGTGTLTIAAKRMVGSGGRVCGIDASPEMIGRARDKNAKAGVEVDFRNAVVEALPFGDGEFDVVLASMMLHHLPEDVRRKCVCEIRRVLKPDGRLLAVDLGGAVEERRGLIARFHRHKPNDFDLGTVVPLLGDAGLMCVERGAVGFGDLQYILAAPEGVSWKPTSVQAEGKAEERGRTRVRAWMLLAGVIGLLVVLGSHAAAIYYGVSYRVLPTAVVAGAIVLIVVKHLGVLGSVYSLLRGRLRRG
jgi:ubiquinone/menaquinone biosynthesis C-methylase UbiE